MHIDAGKDYHKKRVAEPDQTSIISAFGALACLLAEYRFLSEEMALADSLTSDGMYHWLTTKHALTVCDAHRP